jgi:glycerol kinase
MAKAALESVGYQTRDLLEAMSADWQATGVQSTLRVDGGSISAAIGRCSFVRYYRRTRDRPVIQKQRRLVWRGSRNVRRTYLIRMSLLLSWVRETIYLNGFNPTRGKIRILAKGRSSHHEFEESK